MKKFILAIFIFTGYCYALDWTFWTSTIETMEFRDEYDSKEYFSESKFKPSAGIKFNSSNLSGVFSWFMKSSKWSQILDFTYSDFYDESKFNYALKSSPDSRNIIFPLEVYAGTIKTSQSASRIKSPSLISINPLTKYSASGFGLFPSLPSSSGTKEDFALGLRLFPQYFPQTDFYLSSSVLNFSAAKNFNFDWCGLKLGVNGGLFSHSSDAGNTWYLSKNSYKEDKYAALCFEFNFDSYYFSSSSSFYTYENPNGNPFFAVRSKNLIYFNNFLINLNYYSGDENLITADGSQDRIKSQIQINPQLEFKINNLNIGTGICAGADFRCQKTLLQEFYNNYSGKAGINLGNKKFNVNALFSCNYSTLDEEYEWSSGLKFYWYGKSLTSSTNVSAKIFDDEKQFSASENLSFKKNLLRSGGISSSFLLKENQLKTLKNSLNLRFEHKNKSVKTCAYIEYVAVFYYNLINCN